MQKKENNLYRIGFLQILRLFSFFISLCTVAWGQPAQIGWLGAISAVFGFALFFYSLPFPLSNLQRFLSGTLWFSTVQLIQLSWMSSIEFQGYYILFVYFLISLGLGCQFGLFTVFVPPENRIPIGKILWLASLWTLMEWLRLLIMCGFSWNPIGLALTHYIAPLQFSSLFGILGLSFFVMMSNLFGLTVLRTNIASKCAVYWLFVAGFPYLFGIVQLKHYSTAFGVERSALDVALVQTDLLPSEKIPQSNRVQDFISPLEQWKCIFKFIKEKQKKSWDLIVLPEAAVPMPSDLSMYSYKEAKRVLFEYFGPEAEKKFPPLVFPFAEQRYFQDQKMLCVSNLFWCQALANLYDAEVIAGLDHFDRKTRKNFNSAFYFKSNNLNFDRYDKQILLPLAEYLPFNFLRPLTKSYGITDFFSHGEGAKVFGQKIPFSPSICYEETFSEAMRKGRALGAELFVNVTNDNYYPDSGLHQQHLFHARLRAVENGVPLIRACNSGVTAVIDCCGRILAKFEPKVGEQIHAGVLKYHFTPFHFQTLFSFWGEGGIISLSFIFFLYGLRIKNPSS